MRRLLVFALFMTVITTLVGTIHGYLHWRLVALPGWGAPWQALGTGLIWALALGTPLGMVSTRLLPRSIGRWFGLAAFTWLGVMFLLLTATLSSELIRLASHDLPEPLRSRAVAIIVLGVTALATMWGVYRARGRVRVKRVRVELARLSPQDAGFKLVQLSDVHVGPSIGRGWLERVVADVNALDADAVVITGDLVDGSVQQLAHHVAPLADLITTHGTFFVTGNHEYYSGADEWLAHLATLGVRTLRNERVALGHANAGFDLAGVDDWNAFGEGHGRDLKRALEERPAHREVVLLAHQPRQIHEASEHDVGLQLSGHTHGGQIFPWNFFVRLQQPFVRGHHRVGRTQLYISNGTGYWGPPLRLGAAPEITLLELHPGKASSS